MIPDLAGDVVPVGTSWSQRVHSATSRRQPGRQAAGAAPSSQTYFKATAADQPRCLLGLATDRPAGELANDSHRRTTSLHSPHCHSPRLHLEPRYTGQHEPPRPTSTRPDNCRPDVSARQQGDDRRDLPTRRPLQFMSTTACTSVPGHVHVRVLGGSKTSSILGRRKELSDRTSVLWIAVGSPFKMTGAKLRWPGVLAFVRCTTIITT